MYLRTLLGVCALALPHAVMAQAEELATCRNPVGKAYRHYAGPQDKAGSGWTDERISNGVLTLIQSADKSFDMLYVDVRKKPISILQDGAKIFLLRISQDEISLLANYQGPTTEIYTFFRETDGRVRYSVLTSRVGPDAFAPKSSVMVGDCDALRIEKIR